MLDLLLHSAVFYLANVDGLHEVPESVAALVTEENSPGRSQVLTGDHGVAQVLLLSRNLEQLPVLRSSFFILSLISLCTRSFLA